MKKSKQSGADRDKCAFATDDRELTLSAGVVVGAGDRDPAAPDFSVIDCADDRSALRAEVDRSVVADATGPVLFEPDRSASRSVAAVAAAQVAADPIVVGPRRHLASQECPSAGFAAVIDLTAAVAH